MRGKTNGKIINPTKKLIGGGILTLILSGIAWLVILIVSSLSTKQVKAYMNDRLGVENDTSIDMYNSITSTGVEIAVEIDEVVQAYFGHLQTKANLSARASYESVSALGDDSIGKVGDGVIAKVENGEITLPVGSRVGARKYVDQITEDRGLIDYDTPTMTGSRKDTLVYSRIKGPYYYLEIVNGEDMLYYIDKYVNIDDMLEGIEAAYNVSLYLVCPDRKKSKYFYNLSGNLVYYPGKALTDDPVNTLNTEDFLLPSDPAKIKELNNMIKSVDKDVSLNYAVREVPDLDSIFIIAAEGTGFLEQIIEQTSIGFDIIFLLAIVFVVWMASVFTEMTRGNLTDYKKKTYEPGRVRIIAMCYGILGSIIVFAICVFFRTLSNIYVEITESQNTLAAMEYHISNNEGYLEKKANARRSLYLDYARRAAELINKTPELNNKEDLAALNSIIGTEYIMLFDSEGKETGTSADYIKMELGDDKAEHPTSTADFRRILKGVPAIAHKAVRDEVTGRTLELYGVRMNDMDKGGYGVLILAVKPEGQEEEDYDGIKTVNGVLRSMTPAGKLSFIIDEKAEHIVNSNEEELAYGYYTVEELGIKPSLIRDDVSDFEQIDGQKVFCVSRKTKNNGYIFVCTPNGMLYENSFRFGIVCALAFAFVFLILSLYLTHGYNCDMIRWIEEEGKQTKAVNDVKKADASGDESLLKKIRAHIRQAAGNATPERKAVFIFEVLLGLALVQLAMDMHSGGAQRQFVMNYVLTGKWNKGFNVFALTSIVLLLCTLILGMMFVRFVAGTLGRMLNSRGQTICRLIANLINYIAILVFIYYALSYLGVDTNAILASVGVIGIGVSMGARDLIADIFAGVSMIFEGEYQVGDIVDIDGYRGMVQEVGVRSTRLIGRGGNIKVIGNKDIKSVTNLTKMNSWVAITIKIDVNYPLRDAEEILSETLPKIGQQCPQIISGPYYKGVLSVEMGFAVLSIIAECDEEDYHKVQRTLIREVLLALREKNVPVR